MAQAEGAKNTLVDTKAAPKPQAAKPAPELAIVERLMPRGKHRGMQKRECFAGVTLYELKEPGDAGYHYVVDKDGVTRRIPESEVGFHAGDGWREKGGNMTTMAVAVVAGGEAVYPRAARLIAGILRKRGYKKAEGAVFFPDKWGVHKRTFGLVKGEPYSDQEFIAAVQQQMDALQA